MTSRYEGINAALMKFIKFLNCLLELVQNLEHMVKDYRNNEFIADYKSLYLEPVMTTELESIERAVSQIYTKDTLFEVKKQIDGVAVLIVLHTKSYGSLEKFMLRKFRKPHRVYSVFYENSSERYECSCKLWNSIGISCSHIICVLNELEKDALQMWLVLKRWFKDAKFGSFHDFDGSLDSNRTFRERIAQLLKEVEAEVPKGNSTTFMHAIANGCDILDPKIIKSKGAPRSSSNSKMGRWCRHCHGFRHDRHNCIANDEDGYDEPSGSGLRPSQGGGKRSCRAKNNRASQGDVFS
ncbi:Protein FAR1-RELATED SEQUENCE [Arachis hypogaea]|nr:Protein FAR1-RELATED SEQUENCE [Arachis hypogaea]